MEEAIFRLHASRPESSTITTTKVSGHAGLAGISANGARANQNNLTLDGVGNVDTGNNGDQLATVSLDAVEEFKI
jgi:hypothetical protein